MSSKPGNTLESFLMWEYDLIVDDDDNANKSLRIAEIMGQPTKRIRITTEQFKPIVAAHERFREQVEELLDGHDDDESSWRDFASHAFGFIPKELFDLCAIYLQTLKPVTTVVQPDINVQMAEKEAGKETHIHAPYGFIVSPIIPGELAYVTKERPVDNPKPATYHEKQLFDNLTMLRNLMHTITPPQHISVPKFDIKTVDTAQFEETGHINGGEVFFGYTYVCTANRRWHKLVKYYRKDRSTVTQHFIDGIEIPADHLDVALQQPILVTPAEIMVLRLLKTEYEPAVGIRKQVTYDMLRRLMDKGLIDGDGGRFKLSEFGKIVWIPPILRTVLLPQPIYDRYIEMLNVYETKLKFEQPAREVPETQTPTHLWNLLGQLWTGEITEPLKANRFLAYVQTILIVNEITTVEAEREFTRPYLK